MCGCARHDCAYYCTIAISSTLGDVFVVAVCACVLCALSISNTLERITCPTIVLCVLLVLLSSAVLLLLSTTSTVLLRSCAPASMRLQGSAQVSISHAAWVQEHQLSQVGQPVQRPRDIGVVELPSTTKSVYTYD